MEALWALFDKFKAEALARENRHYPVVSIQEAGLDGFWLHRMLVNNGIESHVVDAASIAVPRKRRAMPSMRPRARRMRRRCCWH